MKKTFGVISLFLLAAQMATHARAEGTICAEVKLEILQKATLERVGFDARLGITNHLTDTPFTNLGVTISIRDGDGNPADGLFFVKVSSMNGATGVDGSGVVQPNGEGIINWLIIPSTGAGRPAAVRPPIAEVPP